jgi:hypothetical protein
MVTSFFSSSKTKRTACETQHPHDAVKANAFDRVERYKNAQHRHSRLGHLSAAVPNDRRHKRYRSATISTAGQVLPPRPQETSASRDRGFATRSRLAGAHQFVRARLVADDPDKRAV